jgi:hypothetical protein
MPAFGDIFLVVRSNLQIKLLLAFATDVTSLASARLRINRDSSPLRFTCALAMAMGGDNAAYGPSAASQWAHCIRIIMRSLVLHVLLSRVVLYLY